MNKKKKIIIIAATVVLALILFYPVFKFNYGLYKGKFSGGFSKIENVVKRWFAKIKPKKYTGPKSTVEQKIVQEESVVIDVVEKVSPSVVSVVVKTVNFDYFSGAASSSESGIGTGFIVDANGLVMTNSHVVDNPDGKYSVVLKDGTTYEVNKVHLDKSSDIAILEVTARNLSAVEFGDSDALKVGQKAIAIGNALGRFQNTVTTGVVSGIARQIRATSPFGDSKIYEDVIQTDAALNPGNSGGPLLNSSGQVIGINVATTSGVDNIGFAIPVNDVKPILASFIKNGRIIRPFLGVSYTVITKEIAALRGMPQGAFVSTVVAGSPAEKAELKRGDIIKKIDDQDITGENSLANIIMRKNVGDKIELLIDRENKEITLYADLVETPGNL